MARDLSKHIIDPDEIFLDSKNIPGFDKSQLEGRFEKPVSKKTFFVFIFCLLGLAGLLLTKTAHLQVVKGEIFALRSKNNYLRPISIPASRGLIYDRNGKELAWNDAIGEAGNAKFVRSYADLKGLAHVLGYIGIGAKDEIAGKDGAEKKYNSDLKGKNGMKLVEMDSKNETKSESVSEPPENGKDIRLTIDSRLQSELSNILEEVIKEREFNGGAAVILDVSSGEILALTSYPEYDSRVLSRGGPEEIIRNFLSDEKKPFLNRALSGLYAPGSIIKPLIALAALNEKIISPDKEIFSSGSISLPNPFFPDKKNIFYDWKVHGWVNMRRAIAVSSNIYFYTVGGGYDDIKGLGITKINKYANLFGFGSKTGVDLDKEEDGLIPSPAMKALTVDPIWRIGDTYNVSIGQGDFLITPLQAAVYAASLATDGRLIKPRVTFDCEKEEKAISFPPEYFQIVKEGMRLAVLEGTAQALNVGYTEVAAKTGTAELEYGPEKFVNSWLIAFFPYKNPKIALSIVLERGNPSNLIGGVFVARRLLDWMIIHTPEYLSR
jgi:penicillin-binding protein 2